MNYESVKDLDTVSKEVLGFTKTSTLWLNEAFGLKQFQFPDIDLGSFIKEPTSKKLRLGHQVEYLFKQLLQHSDRYEVLASNIQIKANKITLGELDFIVLDRFRESAPLHIELTYKFYIVDFSIADPIHQLMGPNRKDDFFTKLEKTKNKQLPLLHSKEGEKALARYALHPNAVKQEVYFLAQLFIPYGSKASSIKVFNPSCIVGYWLDEDQFLAESFKSFRYYLAPKNEWTHVPHLDVGWSTYELTLLQIKEKHTLRRAPMLWVRHSDNRLEKFFIVWKY